MSELIYFFKFLKTRWYILLALPLVAMAISYFLTKQLPNTYRSEGRLATGVVDKTDQLFVSEETEQESEINRKFDNLIQLMRMKKVMDQVSYRLLLHDLTVKADLVFKEPSKVMQGLTLTEKKTIVNAIGTKYKVQQELYPDNKLERKLSDLIESNEYGSASLLDKLVIKRLGNSDYISIEFEGTNPAYTAFVVNSLSEEFLRIYSSRLMESNNRSLEFFEKMMLQKLASLNERMQELKTYKIQNRVLNLNEQARSLYGHIIDFETRREIAKKDVMATRAALRNLNQRFDPSEQRYIESALSEINQKIAITRERLQSVNDLYIRNNFDPRLKVKVDSLQVALNRQIQLSTDKNFANPQAAKNDLVNHKLELEISLELAENSIYTIESEVNRLNRKYDGMVPNEASIQQFETSIEIASKEYIEALQRYNNARLDSYSPITLRLIERATRGELLPSKKLLLVIVSGLASFVFCFIFFTVLYFLDNAVRTPAQLAHLVHPFRAGIISINPVYPRAMNNSHLAEEQTRDAEPGDRGAQSSLPPTPPGGPGRYDADHLCQPLAWSTPSPILIRQTNSPASWAITLICSRR